MDQLPFWWLVLSIITQKSAFVAKMKEIFFCVNRRFIFYVCATVFWVSSLCASSSCRCVWGCRSVQKAAAAAAAAEECWTCPQTCQADCCIAFRHRYSLFTCLSCRPKMPLGKESLPSLWPPSSQVLMVVNAIHQSSLLFPV